MNSLGIFRRLYRKLTSFCEIKKVSRNIFKYIVGVTTASYQVSSERTTRHNQSYLGQIFLGGGSKISWESYPPFPVGRVPGKEQCSRGLPGISRSCPSPGDSDSVHQQQLARASLLVLALKTAGNVTMKISARFRVCWGKNTEQCLAKLRFRGAPEKTALLRTSSVFASWAPNLLPLEQLYLWVVSLTFQFQGSFIWDC